jgi:hypothetical protein
VPSLILRVGGDQAFWDAVVEMDLMEVQDDAVTFALPERVVIRTKRAREKQAPVGGCVYFIQSEETFAIKIGFTGGDAEDRLAGLQTGHPGALRLLVDVPGTRADESTLHKKFASQRMSGEWFRPCDDLLELIEHLKDGGSL